MAKQAEDGSSIESGFDFSRFLDLDDDSSESTGADGEPTPRQEEITTGGLESDLEAAVETYIKAGKVSWTDKRNLRHLAAENRSLEDNLRETDAAIVDRANGYHSLVAEILREKNTLESFALEDSDPYDSGVVGSEQESVGSREAQDQSTGLFSELERLEQQRTEINGARATALKEIREAAARQENSAWGALETVIGSKLDGIDKVQDLTKVKFSQEDEVLFDRGVDELTEYIHGNFDPLAEEDEYSEEDDHFELDESPLADPVHSEAELDAIEAANAQEVPEQNFDQFFADLKSEADAEPEVEPAVELEGFSRVESPSDLSEAFDGEYDPEAANPEDKNMEFAEEEVAEAPAFEFDVKPFSEDDVPELESEEAEPVLEAEAADSTDSVADDLRDDFEEPVTHSDEDLAVAQIDSWDDSEADADLPYTDFLDGTADELASEVVSNLDVADQETISEPEAIAVAENTEPEATEDHGYAVWTESTDETVEPVYVDFSEYSSDGSVRTVIFDELKKKYGISFEGVPGLED